jgi:hypothetical protein
MDSYFDRVDAAMGIKPVARVWLDPEIDRCYYNGNLYVNPIAADVARAKGNMRVFIDGIAADCKIEMRNGVPVGSDCSRFDSNGRYKPFFKWL